MVRAFFDSARFNRSRLDVYTDNFKNLMRAFNNYVSHDVTRQKLSLGTRDSVTGWCAKSYDDEDTIDLILIPRTARHTLTVAGYFCDHDAVGLSVDELKPGDHIETLNDTTYEVESVKPIWDLGGDSLSHYVSDVKQLPFEGLE